MLSDWDRIAGHLKTLQDAGVPVDITASFEPFRARYNWKVIATGPGHGIQLRTGRLIDEAAARQDFLDFARQQRLDLRIHPAAALTTDDRPSHR